MTGARLVERDDSRVAPVIYREEGLHPGLSEWVTCAWTYERAYSDEDVETVMPDGTVELVVAIVVGFLGVIGAVYGVSPTYTIALIVVANVIALVGLVPILRRIQP